MQNDRMRVGVEERQTQDQPIRGPEVGKEIARTPQTGAQEKVLQKHPEPHHPEEQAGDHRMRLRGDEGDAVPDEAMTGEIHRAVQSQEQQYQKNRGRDLVATKYFAGLSVPVGNEQQARADEKQADRPLRMGKM